MYILHLSTISQKTYPTNNGTYWKSLTGGMSPYWNLTPIIDICHSYPIKMDIGIIKSHSETIFITIHIPLSNHIPPHGHIGNHGLTGGILKSNPFHITMTSSKIPRQKASSVSKSPLGSQRTASPSKANSSPMCHVEWGPGKRNRRSCQAQNDDGNGVFLWRKIEISQIWRLGIDLGIKKIQVQKHSHGFYSKNLTQKVFLIGFVWK